MTTERQFLSVLVTLAMVCGQEGREGSDVQDNIGNEPSNATAADENHATDSQRHEQTTRSSFRRRYLTVHYKYDSYSLIRMSSTVCPFKISNFFEFRLTNF